MAVYVDMAQSYPQSMIARKALRHGFRWSHLWADSTEELHIVARAIGLRRSYFQDKRHFPHYDVTPAIRNKAILYGARISSLKEWFTRHPVERTV